MTHFLPARIGISSTAPLIIPASAAIAATILQPFRRHPAPPRPASVVRASRRALDVFRCQAITTEHFTELRQWPGADEGPWLMAP